MAKSFHIKDYPSRETQWLAAMSYGRTLKKPWKRG